MGGERPLLKARAPSLTPPPGSINPMHSDRERERERERGRGSLKPPSGAPAGASTAAAVAAAAAAVGAAAVGALEIDGRPLPRAQAPPSHSPHSPHRPNDTSIDDLVQDWLDRYCGCCL